MERSKREIPHYYLGHTIDLGRTIPWLDALNDDRPITTRILPAVPLLKATALALTRTDGLNGHMVDGTFRRSDRVHLGVAVSLRGGGLVAPAIHDADQMSLDDLMAALSDLVARARAGKLKGSEMTDATATVTNLGDRGVDVTFPVIIPPQVAIIGFGRIADGPAVVDGQLVIRPMVQVSLAADHRVTDGHTGGLFLLGIERLLQEPELL
jgi:pyruvate dehydrogenase E2 component (dihydrolipoamide acetyltransferase)